MAKPRKMMKGTGDGLMEGEYFHLISRVVDRRYVLEDEEREHFRGLLRKAASFSVVEVVTWTMLSNHFHLVVRVPEMPADPSVIDLWGRLEALYTMEELAEIRLTYERIPELNPGAAGELLAREYLNRFLARMFDLSEFMKTLMQRFTQWFNRKHDRVGRLWESRFKSVLLEGRRETLIKVAAYVDLNAVRAGMVDDPKDYRWCGYAEAVAGDVAAIEGLGHIYREEAESRGEPVPWSEVASGYRRVLFDIGQEVPSEPTLREGDGATGGRQGFGDAAVASVRADDGRLSTAALLRCRIRYFTDGVAIGSKAFVENFFREQRQFFGEKRKSGARKLRLGLGLDKEGGSDKRGPGGDWEGLRSLRDLQRAPIERSQGTV